MDISLSQKTNIDGLDFLKAVAATLIVFHHYQQVFGCCFSGVNFSDGAIYFGYFVELFFMISGFLTAYTHHVSGKQLRLYLSALKRKLLRIYPMAALACLFCYILVCVERFCLNTMELSSVFSLKAVVANFGLLFSGWPYFQMTGINNPTWYLCILVQCYLVFYLCVWLCEKISLADRWRMVAEVLLMIVVCGLKHFSMIQHHTFRGLFCFFAGVFLEELLLVLPPMLSVHSGLSCKLNRAMIWICGAALIVSLALLLAFQGQGQLLIFMGGVFPELLILAYATRSWECHGFRVLGKASFELFVWHYPLMYLWQVLCELSGCEIHHTAALMVIFACLAWLVAWLLYSGPEKWMNRLVKLS